MQEIFNNDFYAVEESDQKPVFPEDDDFMEGNYAIFLQVLKGKM